MESDSSEVKIISKCLVKPKTFPEKWKDSYHFSPLDHMLLSIHYIQKGLLFVKPSFSESENEVQPKDFMETLLKRLKDSLAATLIHFFPLAGRISTLKTENPSSHSVFVDCNYSPGAGFIHAQSDLTVSDVVGSKYVPSVVYSFFDHRKALNRDGYTMSLLSVQVTELVDGVFIGLSMNHSLGDGSSFWQFFNSLSEIFNSQEEIIDNDNKKMFRLKNPPIFREASGPIYTLPFSQPDESFSRFRSPDLKERMFHFSSDTLRTLKSKANQECGTTKISFFQSLTAFIWRSIIKARKLPNDEETTCRFAAGNRSRLSPPLPDNYFGNYISLAKTTTNVANLLENQLGWAALKLHQAVTERTGEKITSEMNQLLKCHLKLDGLICSNIVHMGSSPRFNKYGPEFGMGKAVALRSGYGGKYDGKVTAYPGREAGGSIDLEVCLLPEFMEALESDQEFMSLVSLSY